MHLCINLNSLYSKVKKPIEDISEFNLNSAPMLEGVKTLFTSHLCLVKLLKSIKDPHFNFETFSYESHLVGSVLGSQVFLPLLFILPIGVEVDIFILLIPQIGSIVLRWRWWLWTMSKDSGQREQAAETGIAAPGIAE